MTARSTRSAISPTARVAVDAGHGVAFAVDGIRRAGEVRGEDVAEQLSADRAAALRGADDCDRARPEERLERRAHRDVVALGHVLAVRVGGCDREPDLELAAFAGARDREAGVAEDAEHRVVVVQHLGDELLDAGFRGAGRELLEQSRADPSPLELVADGERDLGGARVAQPHPVRDRDDTAVERPDQRAALLPVRLEHRLDELRPERGKAVEAEIAAALGEVGEEREQRVGVLRGGCPQPQRRAVAEDDVGRLDRRCRYGAHAAAALLGVLRSRPDDEHGARRRVDEPGRDAAGEEPPCGAPTVRADDDQLRVVLARDLADLLDREPVGHRPSCSAMPAAAATSATVARSSFTRLCSACVSSATMFA